MAAPLVFDRIPYLHRQHEASGDALALLDARVAAELQERLKPINRSFEQALVIAPRADGFAEVLRSTGKFSSLATQAPRGEEDLLLPADAYHAVLSLLDLHAVNDVPGYMAQIARSLKPDGLAMFGFFAGETLRELREVWLQAEQQVKGGASPRVAPMIDLRETGALLQRAGLVMPVADVERTTLRYADAMSLMREIKATGFSNCLTGRVKHLTGPTLLLRAAASYPADADGRISATVEIAWAAAWKPHPSQQQPLKPGSATIKLATALGAGPPHPSKSSR